MNAGKIRARLMAGVALIVVALAAVPASAAVMVATYTGTVTSNLNVSGAFGFEPNASMTGAAVTMIFKYDPSLAGTRQTTADFDAAYGGSGYGTASPMQSATISINGVANQIIDPNYIAQISNNVQSLQSQNQVYTSDSYAGPAGTRNDGLNANAVGGQSQFPVSLDQTVPLTLLQSNGFEPFGTGYFQFVRCAADEYCIGSDASEYSMYVYGEVAFDSIKIEALSPVPLPAALPLLVAAFGGLGFVARRRRASSE